MRLRGLVHGAAVVASALVLVAAITSAAVVVVGGTVLAVRPATPRDRAIPIPLPTEGRPLRVTVLGTSLSAPNRYRWPDQLAVRLSERLGLPVEVKRLTRAGATSTWGATQAGAVVSSNPDVVLVELVVNDADVRHRVSIGSSVERHEALLTELQTARPATPVVLLTMNPASGPRSWARPFLSRYYAEYADLAHRSGSGLVDLYPRWLALSAGDRELLDGLHPSDAAAARMIVDPVADALAMAAVR